MNRRSAVGLLILLLLIAGGRWIRHSLLLGPAGAWREPGLWESLLPRAPTLPPDPPPRKLTVPLCPNSCSEDSLTLLPGIGPVLAARIVAARREGRHFSSAADLAVIPGIGPATVRRLIPHLHFAPTDTIHR